MIVDKMAKRMTNWINQNRNKHYLGIQFKQNLSLLIRNNIFEIIQLIGSFMASVLFSVLWFLNIFHLYIYIINVYILQKLFYEHKSLMVSVLFYSYKL